MKGRKPKPGAMKRLAGNPGKRAIKAPTDATATPCEQPPGLSAEAAAEWQRITELLAQLGILGALDRAALALYCEAWSTWKHAQEETAKTGAIVKSPSGFPIINPWLSVANTAAKQIRSMLAEFGLSPSARERLTIKNDEDKHDDQAQRLLGD